jgi:hypothetical protein
LLRLLCVNRNAGASQNTSQNEMLFHRFL